MSLLRKWTAILGRVFLLKMKSEGSSLAYEEGAVEGEGGVLDNKIQENLVIVAFSIFGRTWCRASCLKR